MARIINSHKFKLRNPPPPKIWKIGPKGHSLSFQIAYLCVTLQVWPVASTPLYTTLAPFQWNSRTLELKTRVGREMARWKKNVYGKMHDHIFIHTKVCIYMHLLYFVYCIYILCNMYVSNIFEIFFDAILYALKNLWKSPCMIWVPLKLLGDSMEPAELQRI